jgi:cholesterol oxidase
VTGSQDIDGWDYVVIGSGFGGSVCGLRLAEKGYKVLILEQGRRWRDQDFAKTNWNLRKAYWFPLLRWFGPFKFSFFRHLMVVHGVGVGGGSLVYANTHLRPKKAFYHAPEWAGLANWQEELRPHYETAERMLGVADWESMTPADEVLRDVAKDYGTEFTFGMAKVAVYAGQPGKTVPDPYFGGDGPPRTGCTQCGGCMVGCRVGAKNTLVKNYLYFAERRGVEVRAETRVLDIVPAGDQSYRVVTERTGSILSVKSSIKTKNIIVAAGCIGTLRLLLRCKYVTKSLPGLSNQLGRQVRTNSEAITGIMERDPRSPRDHSHGIAISSHFMPDEATTIEPVRYNRGSDFMRLLVVPAGDGHRPLVRILSSLKTILSRPRDLLLFLKPRDWTKSSFLLLVMQHLDNRINFSLGRSVFTGFRRGLLSTPSSGVMPPTYIRVANEVTRHVARKLNAIPMNGAPDLVFNLATTAHLIGGACISAGPADGVINAKHEVFGYPGLMICDGSAIPANLGVNPSHTIVALAERAMSFIPPRAGR